MLDVIEEESLQLHAKNVGKYLTQGLQNIQNERVDIADTRGSDFLQVLRIQ